MATDTKTSELEALAAQFLGQISGVADGERAAVAAFKKAAAYLAVRDQIRQGDIKIAPTPKAEGPQLCDCCAPNLPKNHPHNLVSQKYGSLRRVAEIHKTLQALADEKDPVAVEAKFARVHPDLGWDMPTINVARAIFPAYCK